MEMKKQADYKMLIEAAALAGTIMLQNGAEIYRVEDTIRYILSISGLSTIQAYALSTGLMISLDDPAIEGMTVVRRVENKGTHLNAITKVNEISRKLYEGQISLNEAYNGLKHLNADQYSRWLKDFSIMLVALFFTGMFGGTWMDMGAAAVMGAVLALWMNFGRRIHLNIAIQDLGGAMVASITAVLLKRVFLMPVQFDLVVVGAIMCMVPGAAITNAIRDTLHGDYAAGSAKILEAFVKATMIALGVFTGLIITGGV